MNKNKNTENQDTAKEAQKAARGVIRDAAEENRADEKNVRDGVRLDAHARKATIEIAKANATGRVPVSFARRVVRLEGEILANVEDKNRKAVRAALKAYAAELEKADAKARQFKSPSKGVLNALAKINAETWARVETLHENAVKSAAAVAKAWDAFGAL